MDVTSHYVSVPTVTSPRVSSTQTSCTKLPIRLKLTAGCCLPRGFKRVITHSVCDAYASANSPNGCYATSHACYIDSGLGTGGRVNLSVSCYVLKAIPRYLHLSMAPTHHENKVKFSTRYYMRLYIIFGIIAKFSKVVIRGVTKTRAYDEVFLENGLFHSVYSKNGLYSAKATMTQARFNGSELLISITRSKAENINQGQKKDS